MILANISNAMDLNLRNANRKENITYVIILSRLVLFTLNPKTCRDEINVTSRWSSLLQYPTKKLNVASNNN